MTPSDENECRQMLYTGYHYNDGRQRCATRVQRGRRGTDAAGKTTNWQRHCEASWRKLAILNFGTLMPEAAKVAESLNATLVDMRFVKPLDEALILMAASHEALVTVKKTPLWARRQRRERSADGPS